MVVCLRCTMDLRWDAQVCIGCGSILGTAAAPGAPAIPSIAPPQLEAPPNPWRQPAAETVAAAPAPVIAAAPAPVAASVADYPMAVEEEEVPLGVPPKTTAKLAEGVPQDPPGMPLKLSFVDPLPPVNATPEYVPAEAPLTAVAETPAIPVEPSDGIGAVRGVGQPTEETLALPAAYATFAAEPMALADYAIADEEPPAEVVELSFPATLTVAPPAAHVAGWPTEAETSPQSQEDEHATRAANSRWLGAAEM